MREHGGDHLKAATHVRSALPERAEGSRADLGRRARHFDLAGKPIAIFRYAADEFLELSPDRAGDPVPLLRDPDGLWPSKCVSHDVAQLIGLCARQHFGADDLQFDIERRMLNHLILQHRCHLLETLEADLGPVAAAIGAGRSGCVVGQGCGAGSADRARMGMHRRLPHSRQCRSGSAVWRNSADRSGPHGRVAPPRMAGRPRRAPRRQATRPSCDTDRWTGIAPRLSRPLATSSCLRSPRRPVRTAARAVRRARSRRPFADAATTQGRRSRSAPMRRRTPEARTERQAVSRVETARAARAAARWRRCRGSLGHVLS